MAYVSTSGPSGRALLSADQLEELRRFNSPTISNAVEHFCVRARDEGVTDSRITCIFPHMGPIVGYACTALIESARPARHPRSVKRADYWRCTSANAGPKITVVQDLSEAPGGAYWGEVNANIHRALGCIGVITNGTVRDIDEVEKIGFALFASGLQVSHGDAHLEEFDKPVEVFGMRVMPGDLIHADKHGAVVIPREIAFEVAEAARRVETCEKPMLAACKMADPIPELDKLIPPEY